MYTSNKKKCWTAGWESLIKLAVCVFGQISWDQNSTFSGDQIFDHEVEIQFVHEVKFLIMRSKLPNNAF